MNSILPQSDGLMPPANYFNFLNIYKKKKNLIFFFLSFSIDKYLSRPRIHFLIGKVHFWIDWPFCDDFKNTKGIWFNSLITHNVDKVSRAMSIVCGACVKKSRWWFWLNGSEQVYSDFHFIRIIYNYYMAVVVCRTNLFKKAKTS